MALTQPYLSRHPLVLTEVISNISFKASSRCVHAGLASSDYASLVKKTSKPGVVHATANAISVASGRLADTFGLNGTCLSINRACSTLLVRLHLAHQSILEHEISSALVRGIHLQRTSTQYLWNANMLLPVADVEHWMYRLMDASGGEGCITFCP